MPSTSNINASVFSPLHNAMPRRIEEVSQLEKSVKDLQSLLRSLLRRLGANNNNQSDSQIMAITAVTAKNSRTLERLESGMI